MYPRNSDLPRRKVLLARIRGYTGKVLIISIIILVTAFPIYINITW